MPRQLLVELIEDPTILDSFDKHIVSLMKSKTAEGIKWYESINPDGISSDRADDKIELEAAIENNYGSPATYLATVRSIFSRSRTGFFGRSRLRKKVMGFLLNIINADNYNAQLVMFLADRSKMPQAPENISEKGSDASINIKLQDDIAKANRRVASLLKGLTDAQQNLLFERQRSSSLEQRVLYLETHVQSILQKLESLTPERETQHEITVHSQVSTVFKEVITGDEQSLKMDGCGQDEIEVR